MAVKRIFDFNIARRGVLSGIYGNTRNSELFLDKDLCACNISRALYHYLKEENYRVVFYDPLKNKGFWSYSEQDLANFFCLTPIVQNSQQNTTPSSTNNDKSKGGLVNNEKYVEQGEYRSYVPKIKTPFGKLKPRFGPRVQTSGQAMNAANVNFKQNNVTQSNNKGNVVCHYPGINFHNDGKNSFFKLHTSPNGFHNVFANVRDRYQTPVAIVYENPENIRPQNSEEIENQYANFIKTYAEKKLKLKIIVVFGSENKRQLEYDFMRERGGTNSIFFRRSFALRFGLAPSQQDNQEDHENKVNFEKNMYRIGLPEEDEIANLLIRKRICEGLEGTLTPKPFDTLVRSIMLGNFKVPDGKGGMVHPNDTQRLMYFLLDPSLTNMSQVLETIDSGDTERLLKQRIGAKKVVAQIERLLKMMVRERQFKEKTGKVPSSPTRPHMAFIGNPGTGKTTLARLVAQWFREKNVLSKGQFVEAKASDLIDNVVGGTRMKTAAKCEEAMGGILFVDEAYGLRIKEGESFEQEAQEVLLQYMEKPDFCLIIAGYKNEIESLLAPPNNPGLHERFVRSNIITFEDYSPQELFDILMQKVDLETTSTFRMTMEGVLKKLYRRRDENWANARSVENIWQEIRSLYYEDESDDNIIDVRHIPQPYLDLVDDKKGDDAEQQLRSRIGMKHVADQVGDLMTIIQAEQRLAEKTGKKPSSPVRPHMVFLGNPGTGKTTAAKLIGRWFRDKNILTKGHFVESKASDLIDNIVGGTRIKTAAKCEEAMGGILFIDEAYALCVKKDSHGHISYEAEAQDVLIQYMEKPDFLLILAGYSNQMDELMKAPNNPGLRGRFTNNSFIQFRDYEPQELFDILMQKIDYETTPVFKTTMIEVLKKLYRQRDENWANARTIENIWQEIRGLFYKSGDTEVDVRHIPQPYLDLIDETKGHDAEQELRSRVGMKHVADQVGDLMTIIQAEQRLEEKTGKKSSSPIRPHMVFLGNPGTGKTTAAKLIGKWFRDKNVLTRGHFVESKASDLIDNVIGGTRIKTAAKCEEAMGGILFIDEAYALCVKKDFHGHISYEAEAQDVLIQYMEKPDFLLILAGYTDQMNELMSAPNNPGLRGRFTNNSFIQFLDYEPQDLLDILMQKIDFDTTPAFRSSMKDIFEVCYRRRASDWANARSVENIWQEIRGLFYKSGDTEVDVRHIPQVYLDLISEKEEDDAGIQSCGVDAKQQNENEHVLSGLVVDLTSEIPENRATCVEHLEQSVGLLKCSCGSADDTTQGTAFIISLRNHYLLTCSHVVEGKTQFTFSISELQFETPARLLWNNAQCDMALLQVGILPQEARYLQLCHSEKPVGKTTEITLAGYPLGEAVSRNLMVNVGKITNYEANKQNDDRRFDTYMSDINATHGNSGGPVVRQSDYQVIGLLQGGFEQVQVRLITDIHQLYKNIDIKS